MCWSQSWYVNNELASNMMEDATFAKIEASLARIGATSEVVVYMNLLLQMNKCNQMVYNKGTLTSKCSYNGEARAKVANNW